MRLLCVRRCLVSLIICLAGSTGLAHHSNSGFDLEREIAFDAVLTRFQWRNPHVYLVVTDSRNQEWQIETDATSVLTRSGWSRDSFEVGEMVSVRAHPEKRAGRRHALLLSIQKSDGQVLASINRMRRSVIPENVVPATSMAGIWAKEGSTTSKFYRAFRNQPLTEKGQAARAAYEESMNPAAQCIAPPTPAFMLRNAQYLNEVELRDDAVVIRSEFYDSSRTIYLDRRSHPEDGERSNQGHSIGWWDGDTLVIDTKLFTERRQSIPNTGIPSGMEKRVLERLTLSDDGKRISLEIEIADPEYQEEPFLWTDEWFHTPHLEMVSVECDPDVARQYLE